MNNDTGDQGTFKKIDKSIKYPHTRESSNIVKILYDKFQVPIGKNIPWELQDMLKFLFTVNSRHHPNCHQTCH